MDPVTFTPAWKLAQQIKGRELSPVEVMDHFLQRIERLDPKLKAFITVASDEARAAARKAEAGVMTRKKLPSLYGVPLAVKDTLFTKGIRSTGASLVYKDFVPDHDAGAVERLVRSGAIVLGKTSTPEFAMGGGLSYNRIIGDDCHNPWDLERSGGASSGGSAVAVAAGLAPMAIGTDAGGSIRFPACCCGVYGLKQTNGRVADYGAFESMPLFNVVGPITRSVRDAALMLQAMAGYDHRDPLSLRERPPNFLAAIERKLPALTIAWSPDLGYAGVDPEILRVVESAVRKFGSLGCRVEEAMPEMGDLEEVFLTIAQADLYAGHGETLEKHPKEFTPVTKSIMEEGNRVTGPEYAKALWKINQIRDQMATFFERYDLLITPTEGIRPYKIQDILRDYYGKPGPVLRALMTFTPLANVIGSPSATVPCGFTSEGLPIGMLVTGRPGEDVTVLHASAAFEAIAPWAHKTPPIA
jgi:aspartyl-tRNA(Asn)/glutamyl-tRNA(Gln) amidotransferase subunit A